MDVRKYLKRIKFEGKTSSDIRTLEAVHRLHVLNVPFENLDIHNRKEIVLDIPHLYKKIVENRRGGFCYELNGLFCWLLCELGFQCKMISARVYNDEGIPGPEFDHMGIIVHLDSEQWLADVGFGDSFIKPLKLELNTDQKQYGKIYKIVDGGNGSLELLRSTNGKDFEKQYLFSLTKRNLNEYNRMCRYHQSSSESPFTKKRMCTIAKEDGRITLSGLKLIENRNKIKREIELKDEAEFREKLKEYFGIEI